MLLLPLLLGLLLAAGVMLLNLLLSSKRLVSCG
jgi:hypothetical protein